MREILARITSFSEFDVIFFDEQVRGGAWGGHEEGSGTVTRQGHVQHCMSSYRYMTPFSCLLLGPLLHWQGPACSLLRPPPRPHPALPPLSCLRRSWRSPLSAGRSATACSLGTRTDSLSRRRRRRSTARARVHNKGLYRQHTAISLANAPPPSRRYCTCSAGTWPQSCPPPFPPLPPVSPLTAAGTFSCAAPSA